MGWGGVGWDGMGWDGIDLSGYMYDEMQDLYNACKQVQTIQFRSLWGDTVPALWKERGGRACDVCVIVTIDVCRLAK